MAANLQWGLVRWNQIAAVRKVANLLTKTRSVHTCKHHHT